MWTGSQYTSEIPYCPSQRLPSGLTASSSNPSCTWEVLSLTKLELTTLQSITNFSQKLFKFLGWQDLQRTHVISICCDFFWFVLFFQWKFLLFEVQIRTRQEPGSPGSKWPGLGLCLWSYEKNILRDCFLSSSLALLIYERCLKWLQSRMQEP